MGKIASWLHHFFVPSEGNSYRAKALHTDMLTTYLMLAIFLGVVWKVMPVSKLGNYVLGIATDITREKLLDCTNQKRSENGLPPVVYNGQLESAAAAKAADMFAKDYWSHFGPGGTTPWQFILRAGYSYEYAGENLAKNFLFSPDVCEAWMNSPTHRENMLRDVYHDVGFAVVNGTLQGEETTLVVQMFATPNSKPSTVAQNNPPVQLAATEETQTVPTTPPVPSTTPEPQPTTSQLTQITSLTTQGPSSVLSGRASLAGQVGAHVLQYKTSLMFLLILLAALLSDLYWAHRLGVMHVTGKHLAHLLFIVSILAGLFILSKGSVSANAAFL